MADEALDTLDMDGLMAATAAMPDTELEYTHDGWCVLSRDRETGHEIHALEQDGKMHIRDVMVVDALLSQNDAIRSELAGTRHSDGMSLAASIPLNLFHNRLAEAIRQGDHAYVSRWLNDPDHAKFKLRSGRI